MADTTKRAALFDLDGVVLDTESQYSLFWGGQYRKYYPKACGMEERIKGMTLTQIFDAHFADSPERQAEIVQALDAFEQEMDFPYIPGVEDFVRTLRARGVKTAVVTSSNKPKMAQVYRRHPELHTFFDVILTSEDFTHSKPAPECYLKGAASLGMDVTECVAFEDSINGLKSVRAAGITSVALTTTNGLDVVAPLSDYAFPDFTALSPEDVGL